MTISPNRWKATSLKATIEATLTKQKSFEVIQCRKHTSPKVCATVRLTEHNTHDLCTIFFSILQTYRWPAWNFMLRIIWTFILSLQEITESPHRADEQSECQQTVKQDYTEPSVQTPNLLRSLIAHRLLVWHGPESTQNRYKTLSCCVPNSCRQNFKKNLFSFHPKFHARLETHRVSRRHRADSPKLPEGEGGWLHNHQPGPASPQHGAVRTP